MNALLGRLLGAFAAMSPLTAFAWIVAENVALLLAAVTLGQWVVRRCASRPVTPPAPPIERLEIVLAVCVTLSNALTTLAGWALWRRGVLVIGHQTGLRALWDALALLLLMDLAMYGLHRLAHHRLLFGALHSLHHRYDHPRPLTLFVMNPLEALAFGGLWLLVLCVYHASILGIALYLALNLAFGTIGHLGVEPLPARWAHHPLLRHLGGSAFHAGHHVDDGGNFGFYTTIWDRLFGTLRG